MSVVSLLSRLKSSGISVRLKDDKLKINAPKEKLTPGLLNELKQHREQIIEFLRGILKKGEYTPIEPVEKKEYYELSSAQKRLYFIQRMVPDSTPYNMPMNESLSLHPDIDKSKERLASVFRRLLSRHDSFRTSFEMVDGHPVQRVHDEVEFEIDYYLAENTGPTDFVRPFDLSRAPLLRVGLVKTGETNYLLMIDMHHIISDGTSHDILQSEFLKLFNGEELEPLKLQYKDYSEWQNSSRQKEKVKRQELYWLKEFSDELPVLNLPGDCPRPLVQGFDGGAADSELNARETEILRDIAEENDVTLYIILLAVFNVLFYKLSGQEDIIVGTPIAARSHHDLQYVIGMLVNTLAMRNYPSGDKPFWQFLEEVKDRTLMAYENQDYPFEELVEKISINRDTGRNPVFDVMLNLLNQTDYQQRPLITEGRIEQTHISHHRKTTSRFDMTISCIELEERITIDIEYSTTLFNPAAIERFIKYLKKIVSLLPENIDQKLADIEIITPEEKKAILEMSEGVEKIHDVDKTIPQLFGEQAEKSCDGVAVVCVGEDVGAQGAVPLPMDLVSLTYKELNQKSNQLAYLLRGKGVGPDAVVGVMKERSIEMIIAILAILKAGGAYLPIDPEYPQERIDYMLADSNTRVLVSGVSSPCEIVDVNVGNRLACSAAEDNMNLLPAPATSLVYVIYTSGSTGKPKGVMLEHRNLVNLIQYQYRYTDIDFARVLQFTTISFDVSAQEIFSTLLAGGVLVLVSKETINDIPQLLKVIEKEKVKTVFLPASFLKFLSNEPDYMNMMPRGLSHIVTAGEQMIIKEIFRRYLQTNRVYFHNHYGPSESHAVTALTLEPGEHIPELPSIGKPVMNTGIYIVDKGGHLVPVGVAGELVISGIQVGRGYLNRPELTAERFLSVSYKSYRTYRTYISSKIIYKTGDLARWLLAGNIEFLGRIDFQVKIRGFRVELGEIESRLLNHHEIKEAVVLAREDERGLRYLCAYVVPVSKKELFSSECQKYLSGNLPDYMIPSYFLMMDKIPLTPNRKIDRRALPEPEFKAGMDYMAPRNDIERRLADIWSELLGVDRNVIGIDSNFFSLGGHSLKATILTAKVHKELQVKLPLIQVFKTPHIRGLSQYIEKLAEDRYIAIEAVEEKEYYLLSSAQKRIYILQQMEPGSTVYNMPGVIPLAGKPDIEKLEEIFTGLIERHESLRTSFHIVRGEPVQRIHKGVEFEIEYFSVENLYGLRPEPYAVIKDFIRCFDLSGAVLMRAGVIKIENNNHLLLVDMHHIISDGLSLNILVKDFTALARGEMLPSLKIQYKDFSQWQDSEKEKEKIKKQETFWLKEFKGEIPSLTMPTDYPRPVVLGFEGKTINFEISRDQTGVLNAIASREEVTLYMVLLAVYNILLSKLSSQEDIIMGTPVAGRRHADLEPVIGMFVNTLALRNYPQGEKTFREFLLDLKDRTVAAFENQDYPFEDLVEKVSVGRDTGHNPLFDVMLVMQTQVETCQGPPETDESYTRKDLNPVSKFDLTLNAVEAYGALDFTFEYSTRLFKEDTIRRFINYFTNLAARICEDSHQKIADIQFISEKEKQQLLTDFNRTAAEYPEDKTLHRLFEEQAARTPGRTAVIEVEQLQITYHELNQKSNQLASVLIEKGVIPGTIVGIMAERSVEMIIGILGILKAGGAYLPIDPDYPRERIDFMLKDSNAWFLLSEGIKVSEVSGGVEVIDLPSLIAANGDAEPPHLTHPTHLCYLIYTSGSTGKPRGVMMEHGNVVNMLVCRKKEYGMGINDTSLQLFSYVFDGFVTSFFTPVISGSRVLLLSEEVIKDINRIKQVIVRHKITHFISIPALYQGIIENLTVEETFSLKVITLAGDKVLPHVIEMTKQKNGHIEIVVEYGVTECAVMSTIFRHQERGDIVKIGKPIWNTCIYILDKYRHLQPIGAAGELCISGIGLARGYLNKPELTAEKFIDYRSYMSYRTYSLYKTGDLARWLPEGNIEFLGRIDYQVKIRGFRIELGEIENQLLAIKGISEAVVIAREDEAKTGEKYLCAYIVSASETVPREIKAALSRTLPGYMIPAFIVRLERMPLTPSGKVDRKALPVPGFTTGESYAAPRSEIEEKLLETWSEVLNINRASIGIGDNFFELGGHSLKAAVMIARVEQIFNIKVPLVEVFRAASIRELGAYIRHKHGQKGIHLIGDKKLVMLREGKKEGKAFHLFFIHDGAGEVDAYIEFCQHINVEWNCWGIRARLFQNENIGPQNITIEELARQYIDSITAVQPIGPYYIAGWSLGGTIAFEIVRQLEKKSETVSVFGLFDSPPPDRSLSANTFEFTFESELNLGLAYLPDGEIKEKIENLSTIHQLWVAIIDYLEENKLDLGFIKKAIPGDMVRSITNIEQLDIRQLIYFFNIIRSFDRARTLYIPSGKINTTLHYFAARESKKIRKEDWNCYCSQPVMAYEINGDHYSIFNFPEVVSFAKKFNETILESIDTNLEE